MKDYVQTPVDSQQIHRKFHGNGRTDSTDRKQRRSIQALTDAVISFTEESRQAQQRAEEERSKLRQAMMGIANLVVSRQRPTVLRKLNSIENKVDRLLDQQNSD